MQLKDFNLYTQKPLGRRRDVWEYLSVWRANNYDSLGLLEFLLDRIFVFFFKISHLVQYSASFRRKKKFNNLDPFTV